MKLKDRVAVITGAGSGIGRACALEFAREGARVVVADINAAGAEKTAKQIAALDGQAMAIPTDVADPASVQRLLQAALQSTSFAVMLRSR
jgi:NAD(P)-dependent dehydrogenase (short-subunit alcohol dehydrogenase family)